MSTFIDFCELIKNEVASLLEICPPSVVGLFTVGITFVVLLACWRTIVG